MVPEQLETLEEFLSEMKVEFPENLPRTGWI